MVNGSQQPNLHPAVFSTKAIWCRPANLGTADCGMICRGEDSCDYVIKDGVSKNSTPLVPHCEWFCTELGERVQIAAPPHRIIDMCDGTFAFGSQWLGGVLPNIAGDAWFDKVGRGDIALSEISGTLSHIYAFDHFIFNVDRHEYNFVVHDQNMGYAILANDYSRAWINHGFPLPSIPMPPCNTTNRQKFLAGAWKGSYIDSSEVDSTLDKIRNINKEQIRRILDSQPKEWLENAARIAILDWWGSSEMLARIDAISAGIKNATCL